MHTQQEKHSEVQRLEEDDCLWQEVSEDENESDEEDDDEDVQDICLDMEEVEIC